MTEVSISIHATGDVDFSTTDAPTVDAIRAAIGPQSPNLVMAHDFARVLRGAGRYLWALRLEHEEQAHMVTVRFSNR